jgi:hypothetical protein
VIDASRGILVDTLELSNQITDMHADSASMRLFVALSEGNIEIFEYTHNARIRLVHSLALPVVGSVQSLLFDNHRNYLFAGCCESGEVFIF